MTLIKKRATISMVMLLLMELEVSVVEAYSAPLGPDAPAGLLLSARRDKLAKGREGPDDLYLTGQYGHGLTVRGCSLRFLCRQRRFLRRLLFAA